MTASAVLLDISRTVSRIGAGGDSGVDRVERAYIREFLNADRPAFFLTRVLRGVAVLDAEGLRKLLAAAEDPASLPTPDAWGQLARKQSPARRQAETLVRKICLRWDRRSKEQALVEDLLPPGFVYVNVGHTHLEPPHLSALRAAGCTRICTMIHDVIPLDYPEYARPGTPERFASVLQGAARASDVLIYNSADTARRAGAWLEKWGIHPDSVVALLGVDPLADVAAPAAPEPQDGPARFVMLGTIEPRKNHLMILSIWRRLWESMPAETLPQLHIVGRRGWENENIVDILDRAPFMGTCVFEHGFIPDAQLAALMGQARALLFPSFAEGFGYPLAEACQIGLPVICSDLPVYREIAGDTPDYLDPLDGIGWMEKLVSVSKMPKLPARTPLAMPSWQAHFEVAAPTVYG